MTHPLTETRERFLLAILAQIPAERIAEIHFFQPIKQGGIESGVAVAAAWPEQPVEAASEEVAISEQDASPIEEDAAPIEEDAAPIEEEAAPVVEEAAPVVEEAAPKSDRESRHVVYMAHYRYTLKGIDRGKWETGVVAEADAPLVTVDAVVRGVQRRAGDEDDPTRMDGDEVREFVEARRAAAGSTA